MSETMSLKIFQMSEQYWGCLDKMSKVNSSPAETLHILVMLVNAAHNNNAHVLWHNLDFFRPRLWTKMYVLNRMNLLVCMRQYFNRFI